MKVYGDVEQVNLATGERFRRVVGDGDSRLERCDHPDHIRFGPKPESQEEFAKRFDENVVQPIKRMREKSMTVRAKFQVQEIKQFVYGGKEIVLRPQYDTTIPEDQRYSKATPSGEFKMLVDNPPAAEALAIGKFFYVDFTPVEG